MCNEKIKTITKSIWMKNEKVKKVLLATSIIFFITTATFIPLFYTARNSLVTQVSNMPLDLRMFFFYDYVRKHEGSCSMDTIDLMNNIVLHDTGQYNAFTKSTNRFSKAWITGSSITDYQLAIKRFDIYKYWKSFDEASRIHSAVKNSIEYFYDDEYTEGIEKKYDYCKSSFESIYSGIGDCEDFTIALATFLEVNGFQTIVGIINDQNTSGIKSDFCHAFLWIKVDYFPIRYLNARLWKFGENDYEWLLLEPQGSFYQGIHINWLQDYNDQNFTDWNSILQWRVVAPPNNPFTELNDLEIYQSENITNIYWNS